MGIAPLLTRWEGPISIAVYAPGYDLEDTMDSILYYRDCSNTSLVRDFATFHVFFDFIHTPAQVPKWDTLLKKRPSCQKPQGLSEGHITFRKSAPVFRKL